MPTRPRRSASAAARAFGYLSGVGSRASRRAASGAARAFRYLAGMDRRAGVTGGGSGSSGH